MIDWTGKMWHIYTMEYYTAIKNNEFVSFVGTWMNLEAIILSEPTQEQKIKHCMFSLKGGCRTMRTNGHREGSIAHSGLLWGGRGGTSGGWGGQGGITWGETPDVGDGGIKVANHIAIYVPTQQSCMICTCTAEPKVQ